MSISQADTQKVTETRLDWLVYVLIVGGTLGGYCLGLAIERWFGKDANGWRALGIGGAIGSGLGWLTLTSFRPALRPIRFAWLRGMEIFLMVGLLGDITTRWLGNFGPFIVFIILPIVGNTLFRCAWLMIGATRHLNGWLRRKRKRAYLVAPQWDADFDQTPGWPV
jgi:hypothetical protein